MGKTMEMAINLSAKLQGAFGKAFTTAAGHMGKMNEKISGLRNETKSLEQQMEAAEQSNAKIAHLAGNIRSLGSEYRTAQQHVQQMAVALRQSQGATDAARQKYAQMKESSASLKNQLAAKRDEIKRLSVEMRSTKTPSEALTRQFSQAKQEAASLKERLSAQKLEIKSTSAAMKQAEKAARAMQTEFGKAKANVSSLSNRYAAKRSELQKLRTDLAATGQSTANFTKKQEALRQKVEQSRKALQRAEKAHQSYRKAQELKGKTEQFRSDMRGKMMGAVETGAIMAGPIMAAINFESAMADVKKVVDFDTPEQFKTMEKDIINLSKRIPIATEGLASIVAAGGQMGIAKSDLIQFAENAAQMGIAFDVTAEQAGQMMGVWRTAFKMSQDEVVTLGDQINHLGNTTPQTAANLSEMVTRVGALGRMAGFSAGEVAALGASMPGEQPEVAATAMKKMFTVLTAGFAATKTQREMLGALGFKSEEVAKNMQKDAKGTLLAVLSSINKLPEADRMSYMQEIFGAEGLAAIGKAAGNLDNLKKNLDAVGNAEIYAGSMMKEYEARSKTTANSLQLMKNHMKGTGIALGSILLPALSDLSMLVAKGASQISAFAEKYPALTDRVVKFGAAVLGGTVLLTGLAYGATIVISPFITLFTWYKKLREVITLSAVAQRLWNGAMTVGKGLLSGGRLIVYYAKMAAIKAMTLTWTAAQWLWNAAMAVGKGLLSAGRLVAYYSIMGVIRTATAAWTAAQWLWNAAMAANPIGLVIAGIGLLVYAGYKLIKNWDSVKTWFITLWNDPGKAIDQFIAKIKEKFGPTIAWLEEKWNKVSKLFNGGEGKIAGSSKQAHGKPYARGGFITRPHLGLVGEEGPEAIIPLDGSARAMSLWQLAGQKLGLFNQLAAQNSAKMQDGATSKLPSVASSPNVSNLPTELMETNKLRLLKLVSTLPDRLKAWFTQTPEKPYARGDSGPHSGLMASDAAFSLDGNAMAKKLWQQAGQMLGTFNPVKQMPNTPDTTPLQALVDAEQTWVSESTSNSQQFIINPSPIHLAINGNVDNDVKNQIIQAVQQAMSQQAIDLKRMLADLQRQQRRVEYG